MPDTTRLARLVGLLTHLQTKRLLTAPELATQFQVSVRTIYRDVRTLEQAGVPIATEEGRGYSLLPGYRLPPVMFTEAEANALITAEKLLEHNADVSLAANYAQALVKIKSVLRQPAQAKANLLASRTKSYYRPAAGSATHTLTQLQLALTDCRPVELAYESPLSGKASRRVVEPFALLLSSAGAWLLVARCRLRQDYRIFRLDGIQQLLVQPGTFPAHTLTLAEYFANFRQQSDNP